MRRSVTVWILSLMLTAGAYAAGGDAGLTVKAGTTGFGVDLTVGLGEKVNVRLSGNAFSYTYDDAYEFDDDDADINVVVDSMEASLDLMTLGAFLDWHPSGGTFRFSLGAFYNGNEGSLSAASGDTIEIDGNTYEVESLDGLAEFNTFAPYVGIGWGNAAQANTRWHFACDLGVLFHGSADISIKATATDPTVQAVLNDALANEVEDIEDDVEDYIVYPVITLGLSYTF